MKNTHPVPDPIVAQIQMFLLQPIPPKESRFRSAWEAKCRNLPDGAVDVLLETLRRGTPSEQDSAVTALKSRGWDVLETGEIGDRRFTVRARGERGWETIKPMLQLD